MLGCERFGGKAILAGSIPLTDLSKKLVQFTLPEDANMHFGRGCQVKRRVLAESAGLI
jgi:hypothetical protein